MARRKTAPLPAAPSGTVTLYARLSRQAREENLSGEGMLDDLRAQAHADGLRVVGEHLDDGESGGIRDRPQFTDWLDDVRECRAANMYAHHVDRMTREGLNVAAMILDVHEGKDPDTGRVVREPARLKDTKGLDSEHGAGFRMSFLVKAEVAREELQRIKERNRDRARRAKAGGMFTGGQPPFGFRIVRRPTEADRTGAFLDIEPTEAAVLREAAARILAGSNLSAVTRFLNGPEGMKPRRAAAWSRVTTRQVLTVRPSAAAEDLFDADTRAALRQALEVKKPDARKGGRQPARLLSGLLRCHKCDTRLQVARRTDGSVTYRCPEAHGGGGTCTQPVSISATALDAHVEGWFLDKYGDRPEYVRRAVVSGAHALEAAEEAHAAALVAVGESPTPEAFVELQEAHAALQRQREIPQEVTATLEPTGRTVREAWTASPSVHDQRDILAANLADIIVKPGRRGPRSIDPARLEIIEHPSFAADASRPEEFPPGRAVV